MRRSLLAAATTAALALAGCTDTAGDTTAITASDTACEVARTALAAGRNSFEVTNRGSQVTEVYVYGDEDRIVTERENIGPGTKATFTVDLAAGDYEIACKPGQKGDGIRQAITVAGEGGTVPAVGGREVMIGAVDYAFTGVDEAAVTSGETIEFEMTNSGTEEHEFEVFGPDGEAIGEIGPTKPGATGKVTLTFDQAGAYRVVCGIEGHEAKGMTGTLTVT